MMTNADKSLLYIKILLADFFIKNVHVPNDFN